MRSQRRSGLLLLAIQMVLVLSIAGKFAYERLMRPRVWVRSAMYDPSTPLRGRYIGLTLEVDACSLPQTPLYEASKSYAIDTATGVANLGQGWNWEVSRLNAEGGRIVAHEPVEDPISGRTQPYHVRLAKGAPCTTASLQPPVSLFLPEHATNPFPLPSGKGLWTEVTMPKKGDPRPIRYEFRAGDAFVPGWVNPTKVRSR